MRKLFTLLTSAACFFAFLSFAPAAPGQNPAAEEKAIALAQQLKLTPQQEVEVLPILKAEAPKFDAIKNDPFFRDKKNKGITDILHWLISNKLRCEQQAYYMVDPTDPQKPEKIILDKIKRGHFV